MASRLFRLLAFTVASASTLALFALAPAAPAQPHRITSRTPAYELAAMDSRGRSDNLADDAAAAGETGRAPASPPPRYQPPPAAADPIGEMIAKTPAAGPDDTETSADLPYPRTAFPRKAHRTPAGRRHPIHSPGHRLEAHLTTTVAAPPLAGSATPRVATPVAPAPQVRPHRLHILVAPPPHPVLAPAPQTPQVLSDLPQVEAQPAPPPDLDARLAALTRSAVADMGGARLDLSPDLAAGRQGGVVLRLPPVLADDLQGRAADMGFGSDARTLSVTITLSGQGYAIRPDQALSAPIEPGRPAEFAWEVSPTGRAGGMLSAVVTGSIALDGEPVSFPLGVLTAELPPPAVAPAPAPTVSPALAPTPDLGDRLRADLSHLGIRGLMRRALRHLAIPDQPTLNLPLVGEVASGKVVAVGLILLALLILRGLLGAGVRAERRRRFAAFDRDYFGEQVR